MQIINETLMELVLGQATVFENLAVYPLLSTKQNPVDYLTLDEALEQGGAVVTEVSEGGSVPELSFENKLGGKVLLLDGDELIGAKQNRVLNLSILVGAGHKVTIPVSCVEHGRWAYRSHRFSSAKRNLYGKLKARKMASVTRSMREENSRVSDQGEIWDDIDIKFGRMHTSSETGAIGDLYETHVDRLTGYQKAFRPMAGQVGAVFAIGSKVAGVELFDNDTTLSKTLEKLVGSFALDALELPAGKTGVPAEPVIQAFLDRIRNAQVTVHPAVDLGMDLRLSGKNLAGGALVTDGKIVHLSAYNLEEPEGMEELVA